MSTMIAIGTSPGITVASVLNPGFKGIPEAGAAVKYLLNVMSAIRRYDLPIKIYVTKDVSDKIGNILTAMGVRFKLVPADKMTPPYIYIFSNETYFVVKTVDENGKDVAEFSVLASKFIESLQDFISRRRGELKQKKKEKKPDDVNELLVHEDFIDFVKKEGNNNKNTS